MPDNIIGQKIIRMDAVGSTNLYLLNAQQEEHYTEGTLIITGDQIKGKGLGNNQWESEPGKNLTFSFILYPEFLKAQEQFMLNKFVSLGIYDFVRSKIPAGEVKIKWPNDIYIGNGKTCGILINNTIKGEHFGHTVIGIGLNINQSEFVSDAPNPVSLKQSSRQDYNLAECLQELLGFLNNRYDELQAGNYEKLDGDYIDALFWHRTVGNYTHSEGRFRGRITGITEYGQLIIEKVDGDVLTFDFKEVKFEIDD